MDHGKDKDSMDLYGTRPIINYLQRLPVSQFDLILEYANWPLSQQSVESPGLVPKSIEENNMDALLDTHPTAQQTIYMVFADGRPATLGFPRDKVASFLARFSPTYVIYYLDYIINEWNEKDALLHDLMALSFLQLIQKAKERKDKKVPVTDSRRSRLIKFLKTSEHYSPERILLQLPSDGK